MQNLYERLKPEVKERLLKESEKYGLVNRSIIPLLKSTYFYDELKISEVNRLITFSNTETYKWSLWDYKYGEELFNKNTDKS